MTPTPGREKAGGDRGGDADAAQTGGNPKEAGSRDVAGQAALAALTTAEVCQELELLGLDESLPVFRDARVTGRALALVTADDVRALDYLIPPTRGFHRAVLEAFCRVGPGRLPWITWTERFTGVWSDWTLTGRATVRRVPAGIR